jgi:hypothetical protein
MAARRAAMLAAWISPATNSDIAWNGTPFRTTALVPLNYPSQQLRPSRANMKAALLDGLEPWIVDGGKFGILRGRNTTLNPEEETWDPSYIRQIGQLRRDLRAAGGSLDNPVIRADGQTNAPNHVTTDSLTALLVGVLFAAQDAGYYDGAELLKDAVSVEIDGTDRSRVNAVVPASPAPMLHQFSIVSSRTAPPL